AFSSLGTRARSGVMAAMGSGPARGGGANGDAGSAKRHRTCPSPCGNMLGKLHCRKEEAYPASYSDLLPMDCPLVGLEVSRRVDAVVPVLAGNGLAVWAG